MGRKGTKSPGRIPGGADAEITALPAVAGDDRQRPRSADLMFCCYHLPCHCERSEAISVRQVVQ